jgi:hypothetical protein
VNGLPFSAALLAVAGGRIAATPKAVRVTYTGFGSAGGFRFDRDHETGQSAGMAKQAATKPTRAQRKDPYLVAIGEVWPHILKAYEDFKDKKPVIEYELPRRMVYSFPATDYINGLTDRTREKAREIYRQTVAAGQFLVFVRDTKEKILRSYVFPVEEQP